MNEIIRIVEKKLDNNWPVEEEEIRALIGFIRDLVRQVPDEELEGIGNIDLKLLKQQLKEIDK